MLTANPSDPGQNIAAGKARSQGLDMQVAGQLTDAVRLIGAYAYIDAEVTEDNTLPKGSRLLGIARHSGSLMGSTSSRTAGCAARMSARPPTMSATAQARPVAPSNCPPTAPSTCSPTTRPATTSASA